MDRDVVINALQFLLRREVERSPRSQHALDAQVHLKAVDEMTSSAESGYVPPVSSRPDPALRPVTIGVTDPEFRSGIDIVNDKYVSTLALPYTAGTGTATVTNDKGLPLSGPFTLSVFDAATKRLKVVLLVSSRVGVELSVSPARGSDNNANTGDVVELESYE